MTGGKTTLDLYWVCMNVWNVCDAKLWACDLAVYKFNKIKHTLLMGLAQYKAHERINYFMVI